MGLFKTILGDAADELKRNFDEAKKEMLNSVDEMTLGMVSNLTGRTASSHSNQTTSNKEVDITPISEELFVKLMDVNDLSINNSLIFK